MVFSFLKNFFLNQNHELNLDSSETEESDFYGQDFEKEGVVSIWIGLEEDKFGEENIDVLQNLCGVGYYDIDYQESACDNYKLIKLAELLKEMSYSKSFIKEAINAAQQKNLTHAKWIILQYDFAYNPLNIKKKIAKDPIFLGYFAYDKNS